MPGNANTFADPPSPVATEPPSDDHHPITGLREDRSQSSFRMDWLLSKPGCYIDGSVPEVPVKYFTQHLIPPLPDNLSVRAVAAKLDLDELNDIPTLEEDIFVPDRFIAFAGAVQGASLELLKEKNVERASLVVFAENPVAREEWSRKDGDCYMAHPRKPGSYAVLKDKYESGQSEAPGWQDIAVLGVTVYSDRNHQVELQEAYTRIVTAMFEAMRETPHRRFVYGYTIDYKSESMRLWFLSRSELLVSKPFNFVHHQLPVLVHFFLSIQFASLAQLGHDPTMKLFRSPVSTSINRDKDHYDITVHWSDQSSRRKETVFRTVELLSDVGAKTALSTGTREWVALELGVDGKPCGEPVTIRDYWVKDGQQREGNILANIRQAAIESGDAEHIQNVENHLAHVVCHGDVYVGDKRDNAVSLHRRGSSLPEDRRTLVLACAEEMRAHCSMKLDLESTENQGLTHYRIVYKHFGKTIDTVLRMSKLLKLLPQVLNGMSTIHALGHVHRSISPSNISIAGSRAIITGFELAEKMSSNSLERGRKPVGAEQFMAIEVSQQRYLFLPRQTKTRNETPRPPKPAETLTPPRSPMHFSFPAGYFDHSLNADGFIGLDDEYDKPQAEPAPPPPPMIPLQPPQPESPSFKFNTLHDCESFWWTCVYLLIHRKACASSMSGASMLNVFAPGQQLITAWASVFGGQTTEISHEDRQSLLEDKGRFKELCTHVCSGIEITAENLEEARKSLVQTFTDAEKDVKTINHTVGKKLYGVFKEALSTALEGVVRLEVTKRRPIIFEALNVVRVMKLAGTTDYDTKDTRPGPLEARIEMIRLDKPFTELDWQPPKEEDEDEFEPLPEGELTPSPSSSVASFSGTGKRKREDSCDNLPPPSQWKRSRWVDYEDTPQSTPGDNHSQALEAIPEEAEVVKTQTSDVGEGSTTELGGTPSLPAATQGGRRTRRSRKQRWGSTRSHSMGLRSSQN